jgi:4-carboxymuconolactone decarboxylase
MDGRTRDLAMFNLASKRLTDATFAEAIARFGEQGIVELGTIVGYYTAIGNALNAFQVPLPAGAAQPFPE